MWNSFGLKYSAMVKGWRNNLLRRCYWLSGEDCVALCIKKSTIKV